ncbi:hypothetical protein ACFL2Q_08305 [Thermodesulfobacteriota bacterium]
MKAMRTKSLIVLVGLCVVAVTASPSVAADFYVVKSRSGVLMVRDHKPQGFATIAKGPFKTRQKAEQALREAKTADSEKKPTSK